MPVTRELLHAAGYWADMKSSLHQVIDGQAVAALLAGPTGYLLVTYFSNRFIGVPRSRAVRAAVAILVISVFVQFGYSWVNRTAWDLRPDHRLAINPHWAIVSTCLLGTGDVKVHFPKDTPADYDAEFQPVRDRGMRSAASGSYPLSFSARPRHVIVYVMESVGAQFLHVYNDRFHTTPNLDAEAAHSLVMDNFYAHVGQTRRAMVALNTSNHARPEWQPRLYDPQHGLNQPGTMLSQVLNHHGFRTLAITSANFEDFGQTEFLKEAEFGTIWDRASLPGVDINSWGKQDSLMIDKLFEWIDADPAHTQPFFALCWTNQTHSPYALSPGQQEVDLIGKPRPPFPADTDSINRELNVLLDADRQIERMLNGLRSRGLADDTLVIITGDHGEGFNWPHDSLGHGFRVYQENLHIPCILWNPRMFPEGRRSDLVSGQIDLAPTVVDALGFDPAATWQGHSLFDPQHPRRAYFYGALDEILIGLREGNWKYVCNSYTGFQELYNLQNDPAEQFNVASQNASICHDLGMRAGAWLSHLDRYGAAVRP
jgi:arylsulfatase A-like enzyme